MTLVDPAYFCRKCNKYWLNTETIPDKFPDYLPFCPACKSRDAMEIPDCGDLLRNWRKDRNLKEQAQKKAENYSWQLYKLIKMLVHKETANALASELGLMEKENEELKETLENLYEIVLDCPRTKLLEEVIKETEKVLEKHKEQNDGRQKVKITKTNT